MPKKKKLNSKNPKYWDKSLVTGPKIREKKLIKTDGSVSHLTRMTLEA